MEAISTGKDIVRALLAAYLRTASMIASGLMAVCVLFDGVSIGARENSFQISGLVVE